jgi:hypothetical protein
MSKTCVVLITFITFGSLVSIAHAEKNPLVDIPKTTRPYRPGTALSLSLAGSAIGWGTLLVAGLTESEALGVIGTTAVVLGPSAGQVYADSFGYGALQAGVRLGGAGLVGGGMWLLGPCIVDEIFSGGEPEGDYCGWANVLLVAGTGVAVAGTVWSVIDAPLAAKRANRRLELNVLPTRVGDSTTGGYGVVVMGRF